ncbi:PREDICTED: ESCRT-related protein CHMP1A-like [Nelumbo nucifera]|uniref:Uncharacterized protein n=2 Tax=Nelumbo nucifera TaxID=4432 RepID=A0A822YCY0_NELNU|nr:PREDICTED: ESCRT-related protein CHMP1A-like [Nelumbo nucifera]DAD28916.1 TPA_asm: hypothetical protein HUJ06_030384 [Nelumbo nucifera]
MGNAEKLMNQIMELKFTSKSIQRQAHKCKKDKKSEKLNVKKAIEKGNMDNAHIYAENAIQKRTEQMNYLRLLVTEWDFPQRLPFQLPTSSPSLSIVIRHQSHLCLSICPRRKRN